MRGFLSRHVSHFAFAGGSFNLLLDAIDTTTPGTFCNFDGGDDPDFDFVLDDTKEDCGNKPPAFVYSLSYAGAEVFPDFYMQRQCTEYGKARIYVPFLRGLR